MDIIKSIIISRDLELETRGKAIVTMDHPVIHIEHTPEFAASASPQRS
jgi:hypothetical protein